MRHVSLRLTYQNESGYNLDTVNRMAENGDSEYVEWLENKIEHIRDFLTDTTLTKNGKKKNGKKKNRIK